MSEHEESKPVDPAMTPVEELERRAHLRGDRVEHTFDAEGGTSAPASVPLYHPTTTEPMPVPTPLVPASDEEHVEYVQDLDELDEEGWPTGPDHGVD